MARYVCAKIDSPMPPAEAFTYVVDARNFAEWDAGVTASPQVEGDGPALGAAYDVTVKAFPKPITIRYEITELDADRRAVLVGETRLLRSVDEITVGATDTGSLVVYDADLTLKGVAGLANPLLALAFRRIGDRAVAGLRRELGETGS